MAESEDRIHLELSDEQMEKIAVRSAEIVWRNFKLEVGEVTIRSILHVAWIGCVALIGFLWATEKIKL